MADDTTYQVISNLFKRALWFVIGVIVLIWIGYEDRTTIGPTLMGVLIAGGLSFPLYDRLARIRWTALQQRGWASFLTGLTAGTLAMPIATLAMLVKVSIHSHMPPEFTSAQVLAVLGRTLIWASAGSLIGISAALWHRIRA
jgi:hypothetical protein